MDGRRGHPHGIVPGCQGMTLPLPTDTDLCPPRPLFCRRRIRTTSRRLTSDTNDVERERAVYRNGRSRRKRSRNKDHRADVVVGVEKWSREKILAVAAYVNNKGIPGKVGAHELRRTLSHAGDPSCSCPSTGSVRSYRVGYARSKSREGSRSHRRSVCLKRWRCGLRARRLFRSRSDGRQVAKSFKQAQVQDTSARSDLTGGRRRTSASLRTLAATRATARGREKAKRKLREKP